MDVPLLNYIVRQVKRFAVLVPGMVIAYFSVTTILPDLNRRLPVAVAILLTYIITAYVLIPAGIRLVRIIFPVRHLPLYCVTPDGFASDPLNVGVVGTREELTSAMTAAGWHLADKHSLYNSLGEIIATVFRQPYPNAPVSSLYLLGRKQDIAFEIPMGGQGNRHHVRFWATSFDASRPLSKSSIHWHRSSSGFPADEQVLWLGAASLDVGITAIKHNFQLTHMIHPDTNQERELIVNLLRDAGQLQRQERIKLSSKPYRLANRAWRGYLETDGIMRVVHLTRQ